MAFRGYVSIEFGCQCGGPLEAIIWDHDGKTLDDDMVHCTCGRKYLVARPFIVEAREVQERAED